MPVCPTDTRRNNAVLLLARVLKHAHPVDEIVGVHSKESGLLHPTTIIIEDRKNERKLGSGFFVRHHTPGLD